MYRTYIKRINIIFMSLLLVSQLAMVSLASDHEDFQAEAEVLKELNLFKGTTNGFELNRYATRVEAGVIIIRLLGVEQAALESNYSHPFTDVPTWADPYIGYLYISNLTKGIGGNLYGSQLELSPDEFLTFCLRSLSYDDSIGDFQWDKALLKGLELNIIDQEHYEFLNKDAKIYRDDIVAILYNLLNQKFKNSNLVLIDFLIAQKITTLDEAIDLGVYLQPKEMTITGDIIQINNNEKAVITSEVNGFSNYVKVPFGNLEQPYISVFTLKTADERIYECIIKKEVYYDNMAYQNLTIGQNITVTGDLTSSLVKDQSISRSLLIKK